MNMMDINKMFSLDGEVALCSGASSGIGQRMASVLAHAGAKVILLGMNEACLKKTTLAINATRKNTAEYIVADLRIRENHDSIVEKASTFFGNPTILTNVAGVNLRQPYDEISVDSWDHTLNINLAVPFFLAKACIKGMREQGRGKIINIASLQTYRAFANSIAYGASKGGVAQLTRAMAEAWSKYNINANAIAPGFIRTPLTEKVFQNKELAQHNANMTAIGRNGELEDLDGLTIFLSSKASNYITGQIISLDGGFTAK